MTTSQLNRIMRLTRISKNGVSTENWIVPSLNYPDLTNILSLRQD